MFSVRRSAAGGSAVAPGERRLAARDSDRPRSLATAEEERERREAARGRTGAEYRRGWGGNKQLVENLKRVARDVRLRLEQYSEKSTGRGRINTAGRRAGRRQRGSRRGGATRGNREGSERGLLKVCRAAATAPARRARPPGGGENGAQRRAARSSRRRNRAGPAPAATAGQHGRRCTAKPHTEPPPALPPPRCTSGAVVFPPRRPGRGGRRRNRISRGAPRRGSWHARPGGAGRRAGWLLLLHRKQLKSLHMTGGEGGSGAICGALLLLR